MRKATIIFWIPLLLFVVNARSQDFETICKVGSTSWNYIPYGACDYFTTDSLTIVTDTLFNEQNYFVLYNYGFYGNDTAGYLREDTIAGKLWYREDLHTSQEFLVMDLSLNKDDSFTLYDFTSSTEITVDTVYYDTENRKHVGFGDGNMQLCSYTPDFEFIEGVGSTACHLYQGTTSGSILSTALLCCHKDEELIFSTETFNNSCSIFSVNVPKSQVNFETNVYPNPSNGNFTIKFVNPEFNIYSLKIYSLSGQLVYSENINQELIKIDEGLLTDGIYFYKLTNHKDKIISGKILIDRHSN